MRRRPTLFGIGEAYRSAYLGEEKLELEAQLPVRRSQDAP